MGHGGDMPDFEATVRRAFARLTGEDLPRAAAARGWPVRTPAEFERLLVDHVRDVRTGGRGECCLFDLVLAVELGERLLCGKLCCTTMSRRHGCGEDPLDALRRILASPRNA